MSERLEERDKQNKPRDLRFLPPPCKLAPALVACGLRHTGATLYRIAGVSRDDCAAILGHSLAQVTDIYAPPQLPLLARAMESLVLRPPQIEPPEGGGGGTSGGGSTSPNSLGERRPLTEISVFRASTARRNKDVDGKPSTGASVSRMPQSSASAEGVPEASVDCSSNQQDSHGAPAKTLPAASFAVHAIDAQCDPGAGYHPDEIAALLGDTKTEPAPPPVVPSPDSTTPRGYDPRELAALLGWDEDAS